MIDPPLLVGIVDDHPAFRVGLRTALARAGVGVAWDCGSLADAIAEMAREQPDVVIVDVHLGREDGVEAAVTLKRRWPAARMILITGLDLEGARRQASRIGAATAIGKEAAIDDIIRGVKAAASKRPGPQRPRLEGSSGRRGLGSLTKREAEILRFVGNGLRTQDIATALGISPATVNNHVQSALRKLKARNRAQAATMLEHRTQVI